MGYVTLLYVPVRSYSNIIIDFVKLSPVFTKCSVFYPNIPVGEYHIVCISGLWMIVDRLSGFKFLIPVPDNFSAEQCTVTFDNHVIPTIRYLYSIVFDQHTLFTSSHFQSWAASKGIKLEASLHTIFKQTGNQKLQIQNSYELSELVRPKAINCKGRYRKFNSG